jgi:hypothetical protein
LRPCEDEPLLLHGDTYTNTWTSNEQNSNKEPH